jgi:hypothetical protein
MARKELTEADRRKVEAAAAKAFVLYEGKTVPHRSCGIALAQTFNVPWRPYQALRRGGISGCGECGAMKAGELILGEFFGAEDPEGAVTPALREAVMLYQERIVARIDRGASPDYRCNNLTAQQGDFQGERRKAFCTNIAAEVARTTAEIVLEWGGEFEVTPIETSPPGGSGRLDPSPSLGEGK